MATRPEFNPPSEQLAPVTAAGGHGDVRAEPVTGNEVRVSCACGWTSDPVPVGKSNDVWIEHVMERQFERDPAAWTGAVPAEDVLARLRSRPEAGG